MRLLSVLLALLLFAAPVLAQSPTAGPKPSLGMNLNGPADWNTEIPFVDAFRLARSWISQRRGEGWGKGPELVLDKDGWVTKLEPGCFAETPVLTVPKGKRPAGVYTLLYTGKGKIEVSSGKVLTDEPGKMTIDIPEGGGLFIRLLEVDESDPIKNIRFILPGFEATYETEPFHPDFLARWKGFSAFRFMDWQHTNNSKQTRWSDRPTMSSAVWTRDGGIPIEVAIDLANRQNADAWFCIPHLADDDYVRNFAVLVKEKLKPDLRVYVEYSNEVWNGQFAQQRYAGDEGLKLKLADSHWASGWKFTAKRSGEIFKIWDEVFGADARKRVVRVIATQAGNVYVAGQILAYPGIAEQTDALAIAPYFGWNVPERSKDPKTQTAEQVAQLSVDQILDHLETVSLPESIKWIQQHKELADKHKLALVCYEAGQHLVGIQGGENNETMTRLFHAANKHPRMGELYQKYYAAWEAAGGQLLAVFASTGEWSKWGSWGLSQFYNDDPADYPKLTVTLEQNKAWSGKPAP
jgi:hypothetical protein